jgi:hypothetical protein
MQILPGFMNSPERIQFCLANAVECERGAAATALRPHVRTQYLNLARQWRELAADMMALSRTRVPRGIYRIDPDLASRRPATRSKP